MSTNSNNKNVQSTVISAGTPVTTDIKPDGGNSIVNVGGARPYTPGECVMIGGSPTLIQSTSRQ